jgi:hypothetical protein
VSFIALLLAVLVTVAWVRKPVGGRGVGRVIQWLWPHVLVVFAALLLTYLWYFHRPQPPAERAALFRGVSYERDVRTSPRPIVAHVVKIDLRDPAISFLVTPHAPDGSGLRGATTSQFLIEHRAQLAVNGDFFLPWWSDGPADFYPQVGDPTDALGASVSNAAEQGWHVTPYSALVVRSDGSVSIVRVTDPFQRFPGVKQAVSGKQILVDGGRKTPEATADAHARRVHPRTAAALDRSGDTLILFTIDGRQPGYSEGVTLSELADILLEHGGHRALNLDGGGSTTLVIDDGDGGARQLNIPIHTRIPWRERPVANHLGVFAAPL